MTTMRTLNTCSEADGEQEEADRGVAEQEDRPKAVEFKTCYFGDRFKKIQSCTNGPRNLTMCIGRGRAEPCTHGLEGAPHYFHKACYEAYYKVSDLMQDMPMHHA